MGCMAVGVATAIVEQTGFLGIDAAEQINVDRFEWFDLSGPGGIPEKRITGCPVSRSGRWRRKPFQRIGNALQNGLVALFGHDQPASSALLRR